MNIGTNSLLGKFYVWFWFTNKPQQKDLPQDGCVFFRKLFFAIIFCIPFSIIILPYIIFDKIDNKYINNFFGLNSKIPSCRMTVGFAIYGLSLILYSIILYLFNFNNFHIKSNIQTANDVFSLLGEVFLITIILFLSIFSVLFFTYKIYIIFSSKTPSIISLYLKSIKEKYCIKITWK